MISETALSETIIARSVPGLGLNVSDGRSMKGVGYRDDRTGPAANAGTEDRGEQTDRMVEEVGDGAAVPTLRARPVEGRPGLVPDARPVGPIGSPTVPGRCALCGQAGAAASGVGAISVLEFGVAGGSGLLVLEREAAAVEKELGVSIQVYGFDNGPAGLPAFIGDYRDHPDKWQPGDFPMDEPLLRSRLGRRTTLVLGNVAETVPRFFDDPSVPPVGFVAFDLDLYSSTTHALRILSLPGRRTLDHVPVYFDDTEHSVSHRFAGELLAIDEFNETSAHVKIDRWRGLAAIGPSRRRRTCGRCTWPTTSRPSPRGPTTGARCTAR